MRNRGERTRTVLARALAWAPLAIVLAISLYYLDSAFEHRQSRVSHPEQTADFLYADSMHDLEMAEAFAQGEFAEKYVSVRPHRQPLYPALLYSRNDFVFDYITDRIMTEPLYTLCSFATLALALLYVDRGKAPIV